MKKLSVVMPVYNEQDTIEKILEKIKRVPIDKEIVIIDDCSSDGTQDILKKLEPEGVRVVYHTYNKGKGASVRDGIKEARGEFAVIQDADLEYEPNDYLKLIRPLEENKVDIVLGARFIKGYRGLFAHKMGNRFLTWLINILFGAKLNDYATCYKMARKETFDKLSLKENSFDIDVEIVCKALKKNLRIIEVPISYYPRSYAEGKKIRWFDGLDAIKSIFKYRFFE
ncbi:MAG: glycosyltransferase family 2 protein [Candidatus Omnitrophica bacterium]|nr:glycosyltransferase family 2 protein [Candidatus Omnitrophota bacterium]MCM8770311.1 glycosyltransferase family 2 protein [Candidatus Omnitrophota bacterium]